MYCRDVGSRLPQLLIANGRRSGGRQIDSAVGAGAEGIMLINAVSLVGVREERVQTYISSPLLGVFINAHRCRRADGVIAESALMNAEDLGYSTQGWIIARIMSLPSIYSLLRSITSAFYLRLG